MRATIRNLYGEEQPAELEELSHGAVAIVVPSLGHLVFAAESPTGPRAVLTQGPGRDHLRDVKTIDRFNEKDAAGATLGRWWEVELLPNSAGEDRIVVVIHP